MTNSNNQQDITNTIRLIVDKIIQKQECYPCKENAIYKSVCSDLSQYLFKYYTQKMKNKQKLEDIFKREDDCCPCESIRDVILHLAILQLPYEKKSIKESFENCSNLLIIIKKVCKEHEIICRHQH